MFDWLNNETRIFLERGYLRNGQTAEARYRQISDYAENILQIEGFADKFYNYLGRGFYSLSSPILSNFGAGRGLGISCYGSYIDDTMLSIMNTAKEVGIMSKYGGGTSGFIGDLRPAGAPISTGGKSDGAVHFARLYDTVVDVCKQSEVRRGVMAVYLPIDHPDVRRFLKIKTEGNPIQNLFTGVCVSDEWLEQMKAGDEAKREIWVNVLKSRCEIGLPYIFFSDTVNRDVDVFRDNDYTIHASNLCVAPETLLLTIDGEFPIKDLEHKTVKVWNGKKWADALVKKTGVNQPLREIQFVSYDNAIPHYIKLKCTDYHKFNIGELDNTQEVEAKDLKIDDVIQFIDNFGNHRIYIVVHNDFKGLHSDTYCVNEPIEHKAVFNGILTSNCSEIALPASNDYSFVCNLASMNIAKYDEWDSTDAVETLVYFLDSVMTDFIERASEIEGFEKAVNFAIDFRALGIGVLGWHDYLQENMIPFGSVEAFGLNNTIFKKIKERCYAASANMFGEYGGSEIMEPYNRRHATLNAVAPTTSSAFILGQTSQSIEPYRSNYYVKDLAKIKTTIRNKNLVKYFDITGNNKEKVWKSILENNGSVQHLDFLPDDVKDVFKTFSEISQMDIINQAAQRQQYIDQSQSLNLMIHPDTPLKDINSLVLEAHRLGVKTLYYQHSINSAQNFNRSLINCTSCEA